MDLLPAFTQSRHETLDPFINQVFCCDALDLLRSLPDNSVDAIISDFPYNTTACDFESDIGLSPALWSEVWRVIKPNKAVITTGSHPFTALLIAAQLKYYRHSWVWEKSLATGYLNANRQPMKAHEDVIVFGNGAVDYYPQMVAGKKYATTSGSVGGHVHDKTVGGYITINEGLRFPRSVIKFDSAKNPVHPTQKPVELYRYLVDTYTKQDAIVLDMFCGSGTTIQACHELGRKYIGCDFDRHYVDLARQRIQNTDPMQATILPDGTKQLSLFSA